MIDLNLANAGGAVIGFEARGPILGFNIPEAVLLANTGRSLYNSLQVNFLRGCREGFSSTCPTPTHGRRTRARGSRAARREAASRTCRTSASRCRATSANLDANYALSDFDRPHRFSAQLHLRAARLAREDSGCPASCSCSQGCRTRSSRRSPSADGGAVQRSGPRLRWSLSRRFGRPSLCGSLDELRQAGSDPTRGRVQWRLLCSASSLAGGYPNNLGFGNLGRNALRGLLAASRRSEPCARFKFGGRATSKCGGTCSTSSTP